MNDNQKKQVPLRLSPKLYAAIAAWAEDDFRSVNGQIEYLLSECVRQRKKNGKYVSDEIDVPPELDIRIKIAIFWRKVLRLTKTFSIDNNKFFIGILTDFPRYDIIPPLQDNQRQQRRNYEKIGENLFLSVCCAAIAAAGLALTACGDKENGDATAGLKPTEGLRYIPAPDGEEGYWVSGMGAAEVSEVVIPSTYLDEPVTGIKASAFRGNEDLMSVAIPSSVKTIGEMAFYECGLFKAEFSEGLEEIGERAFSSCDMSEIDLPESLKTIGEYAFAYCDSLKEITIPAGVVSIGEGSLHCEALETITVAEGNESYYIEGGCLIERETKTLLHGGEKNAIPDGVVTLGELTFSGSLAESISLPDSVYDYRRSCLLIL